MILDNEKIQQFLAAKGPIFTADMPISEEMLRRFVQASMEEDPLHWDEQAARAEGHPAVVAPLLFVLHAFRRAPGTPDPLDRLAANPDWDGALPRDAGLPEINLPLKRILNGGTEAEFFRYPAVGDRVSAQSRYVSITEREGQTGPMVFITVETVYTNQDDARLAVVRTTLIRR